MTRNPTGGGNHWTTRRTPRTHDPPAHLRRTARQDRPACPLSARDLNAIGGVPPQPEERAALCPQLNPKGRAVRSRIGYFFIPLIAFLIGILCLNSTSATTKSPRSSVPISNVRYLSPDQRSVKPSHLSPTAPIGDSSVLGAQVAVMTVVYLQTQDQLRQQAEAAAAQAAAEAAAAQAAAQAAARARAAYSTPVVHTSPTATAPSNGGGWSQVAICEESGNNDPTYGYFGILPSTWAGHDGVSTAGQASWDEQVAYGDSINGGGPPWAPVGCGNAGYHGW